ncbi:MAG: hydrogenase 4 subunit B [Acidobacteria bacterium]|nr:hydrogenase 4 subunit B [Acidobacteriota bacterium]
MTSIQLLYTALTAYACGAAASLLVARSNRLARFASFGFPLLGALLGIAASLTALVEGTAESAAVASGVPLLEYSVRLDSLSAFFNLALSVLAGAISTYSFGYVAGLPSKSAAILGFFYNVLLLSLTLVFTASNVFFFLIVWEVMAGAAYCLVSFDHGKQETRQAGILFLIMSHAGTALLLLGFLTLASSTGSLSFSAYHHAGGKLPELQRGAVLLLFFFGFGVKAGIIPVHIWLPAAHPVAPSNISALMSGIVIKTGVYGIVRVFFYFFDIVPVWAGTLVLAAGVTSALLGVLYALMEHDLKRLLAYHSIENMGIILIGVGSGLLFRAFERPNLAAVAIVAALYHTLNHAVFKGLLFLGAGSVLHAVHTRNMEQMGGLIRRMPFTAFGFLVGAVAISGLPPLNGFVSEWLTYQALLAGFGATGSLTRIMFPVTGALLALTSALAAACFVKAFGITFLALPRSAEAAEAREAPLSMRFGMGVLAAGCLALGLGATWFLPLFDTVTEQALGVRVSSGLVTADGWSLNAGGAVSTAGIAVALTLLAPIPALLTLLWKRGGDRRTGPVWDCGLPGLTAANQFTATAFSKPLRMVFSAVYRPRREIQADFEVSPYYPRAIRFESEIEPTFEKGLYNPLRSAILAIADRFRAIQAGSVHAYLAYIFVTLILLLVFGARA